MSDVPIPMLRDALRDVVHEPTPDCLDANTLAAWFDESLPTRDRVAAELHVSSCARCLSLLAAMARGEPAQRAAERRSWWRTSHLAWLTPLAAATVAVVLWVNTPPMRIHESAKSIALPSVSSAAKDRQPRTTEQKSAPPEPAAAVSRNDRLKKTTAPPAAATPPQLADATARQLAVAPPAKAEEAPQAKAEAAPQPTTTAASPAAPSAERRERSTDSLSRDADDVRTLAARPQALAESVAIASPPLIVSQEARVRWRILGGGDVERSADAGRTWQRQSTGVAVALTAGSAPSAEVCWLVGPAGTIVLTADGHTWQRIMFAAAPDFVRVEAVDALTATVIAADGRSFITGDGGRTWQPR